MLLIKSLYINLGEGITSYLAFVVLALNKMLV